MEWRDFKFDYRLERLELLGHLIHIEAYREAALNLVLPPEWSKELDKLNRVRAVYGTTALEGNPLSEAEVSHQLDLIEAPSGPNKITREQLQIRNASNAQSWARIRFAPEHPPISLSDILLMHKMVTEESDVKANLPGQLRTFSVVVGSPDMGGVHKGAPAADLTELMAQYIGFINSPKLADEHPVVHALLAHFFLVTIHPFGDGNGRVSRLVEAGLLFRKNYNVHGFYGLSNYFYRNEARYKTLLQECRGSCLFNVTPFIKFGAEGFATELKGINSFIKTKLNRVVYRTMLVRAFNKRVGERRRLLNQREYNLLDFLISATEPVDPFSESPSRKIKLDELLRAKYIEAAYRRFSHRTFVRELFRLRDMGFITITHEEKHLALELDFGAIGKY
jgi:Fic family protein